MSTNSVFPTCLDTQVTVSQAEASRLKQEQADALFTIEALEDASCSPPATGKTLPEPTLDTVHRAFTKAQKAATIRDTVVDALAKTQQIISAVPSESGAPADRNKLKVADSLSKSKLTQEVANSLSQSKLDELEMANDLRWMPTELSHKAAGAAAELRDATSARLRDVGRKLTEIDQSSAATESTAVVTHTFTFLHEKYSFVFALCFRSSPLMSLFQQMVRYLD